MTKPLGNTMDHYWRVIDMANTVGVDLAKQREDGVLTDALWADMVQQCRKCQWLGGCQKFLDTSEGVQTAPFDCMNADRFEAFKL